MTSARSRPKVLPRLTKISKDQDGYFTQVIQACLAEQGQARTQNARLCFQRAALIRPDVQALLDVLLTLDVSLEDRRTAERARLPSCAKGRSIPTPTLSWARSG